VGDEVGIVGEEEGLTLGDLLGTKETDGRLLGLNDGIEE
jgi:hypothetical protein